MARSKLAALLGWVSLSFLDLPLPDIGTHVLV